MKVALILLCGLNGVAAHAGSIGVVGLFPGKAVLLVDAAAPKTYAIGATISDGVKLVGVTETAAQIDDHGKRQTLAIGTHFSRAESGGAASVTLQADSRGHFITAGQINGVGVTMLVDTGASMISMSTQEARRLGIDFKGGQRGFSSTANGVVPVYQVRLNSVRIGDIELSQVDAMVHESNLPFLLLGMSFLNRTQMQRDGERMVLTKRF